VSYLKDTQKWKQFTTPEFIKRNVALLCHISKILKNESNSQQAIKDQWLRESCVISQRYSKMKAIHNVRDVSQRYGKVVSYLKDTQKWKQFTTMMCQEVIPGELCHISKILKNESNSQPKYVPYSMKVGCVISQRYSKMKAIHNTPIQLKKETWVVSYLKDTQKWKQFTTKTDNFLSFYKLCHISKILKNESNSQQWYSKFPFSFCCVISQRYSKMKAIHN